MLNCRYKTNYSYVILYAYGFAIEKDVVYISVGSIKISVSYSNEDFINVNNTTQTMINIYFIYFETDIVRNMKSYNDLKSYEIF